MRNVKKVFLAQLYNQIQHISISFRQLCWLELGNFQSRTKMDSGVQKEY